MVSHFFREWNPHGQSRHPPGILFSYIIEQASEAIVNKRLWISSLIHCKKILQKGYVFFEVWYSFWLTKLVLITGELHHRKLTSYERS
jgi:hypothetical protein